MIAVPSEERAASNEVLAMLQTLLDSQVVVGQMPLFSSCGADDQRHATPDDTGDGVSSGAISSGDVTAVDADGDGVDEHPITQSQLPFHSPIRLGKDWKARYATLLVMKDKKLHDAQRYIEERTKFLDPSAPYTEMSRFVGPNGDLSTLRLDVIPFEGVTSVKQVFDALSFYFFNIETSISEVLGDITIREDDGTRLQGISQDRFISNVREDIQVETNVAMLCKLFEANEKVGGSGGARESGVIVADFVNEDELYPYSPATRLRYGVTTALAVTLEPRKVANALGEEREEHVVVLTRTGSLTLRQTDLPIDAHEMQELYDSIESWGDAMLKTVRGIVYPRWPVSSRTTAAFSPVKVHHHLLEPKEPQVVVDIACGLR